MVRFNHSPQKCEMPLTFIRGILANEPSSSKPDSEGKALLKAEQIPDQDLSAISNRASVLENQNAFGSKNLSTQPSQTFPGFSCLSFPRSFLHFLLFGFE